jgi:hypothetical protein
VVLIGDRAARPCAARDSLSNIIHTQNEALRATPLHFAALLFKKIREKSMFEKKSGKCYGFS